MIPSESAQNPEEKNAAPNQEPLVENVTLSRQDHEALLSRFKELEDLRDRFMRGAADFENAKKRLARERDEFVKFSQESLLRDLLPVLDNFERALSHAGSSKDPVISGIQMVFKQMNEIFKRQGLVRIKTAGEIFDLARHEIVSFDTGKGREDEIVEEIEPGYFLHDRLLRAAKVRVRSSQALKAQEEKNEEIT